MLFLYSLLLCLEIENAEREKILAAKLLNLSKEVVLEIYIQRDKKAVFVIMGKKYSSGCYNSESERLKKFPLVFGRFTEK